MSHIRWFLHGCLALTAGAPTLCLPQAIDPARASIALDRPFLLRLPVRTELALNPARLAACVDAEFQNGATRLPIDEMHVEVETGADGWQWLRFEHPHRVLEPAVLARVTVRCPARFEREFVLQAIATAGDEGRSAAPGAAAAPAVARRREVNSPLGKKLNDRFPPLSRAAATSPGAPALGLDSGPGTPPRTRHMSSQQAAASAPTHPLQAALQPPAASAGEDAGALRARVVALEDALRRSREASRATTDPSQQPVLAGPELGGPLRPGLLMAAALLLASIPARRHWHALRRRPVSRLMQPAVPPVTTPHATPAAARTDRVAVEHVVTESRPEPPAATVPTVAVVPGAASLDDRGAARFTCEVERLVEDGYPQAAIGLLERSLNAGPARNPWLLLQLLGLYEQWGPLDKAARLIGELQTLYRVHLPRVGGKVQPGRGMLDTPALLDPVTSLWPCDDVIHALEDLIFQVPGRTWDLAAFEDLLLLHAVARDRSLLPDEPPPSIPNRKPAFEAVLEWDA